MAVDLGDLIEPLQAEVSPPGQNLFPDATDDDWIVRLQNGFWEARIDGLLEGYTELDAEITTDDGGPDMPRDLQQVVVFYAAYITIRNALRATSTLFRAKAGPVEYETQNSANMLNAILEDIIYRRNLLLARLSDIGSVTPTYYDNVQLRDTSIRYGSLWYTG